MQLLAFWSKKRTLRAFNLRVSVEKMVPLTGLEPVLWKPERDFKSRVSTYSTTAACPPMTGDIKLHNKCQHIDTAYGSIFSVNRQVLQLVEIQREGLQAVV